jgi:hypothetical protein
MAATVNIQFDLREKFDALGEVGGKAVARTVELVALELFGNVRRLAPVDTGRLAGSFVLDVMDELSRAVQTNVEYAWDVNIKSSSPFYVERAINNTENRVEEFAQMAVDELESEWQL